MQINLLRQLGIAARFVGYYYFDMDEPAYELHVGGRFIPGIGWLGLDPSHGILTGNTHFPIASSALSTIRCQFRAVFGSATSNY
jgi:transglutaminase-like putative cysteine protease